MEGIGQDEERLRSSSPAHRASELQKTVELFLLWLFHCLMLLYSHCHERELLSIFMGILQFKILWS